MRALLAAVGTRGDVQPALALAVALRERGHEARLRVSPSFVEPARAMGFEAGPMGVEMRAPPKGASPPKLTPEALKALRASMPDLITDQFDTLREAAEGCAVILGCNAHQYAGPSLAEHLGLGCVTAVYAPCALPSPALAPPPLPGQPPSALDIEAQWQATRASWNARALERINHNRGRLGLPPIEDVLEHNLTEHTWLAADPVLAPLPPTPGREVRSVGTWVLEDPRPLPPEVLDFLDRGAPPVYVGFGSMPAAAQVAAQALAAARRHGRRVLLSAGWAELELDAAPDVLRVGDLPHEALFPRVAAVLHHGGAGTTATAARAGAPQLITPLYSDQHYWGQRVTELGLGASLPHASLSEAPLAEALERVLAAQPAARALAPRLRRDGAAQAAEALIASFG